MKTWFKQNSPHLIVIGVFILLVIVYFSPLWNGEVLYQHDVIQANASQKEIMEYMAKDGKAPLWTNSMFGGMPAYHIFQEHVVNITTYIIRAVRGVFPSPADIILVSLLGSYLLFSALRLKPLQAAIGAIAFTFSSYNIIYIEAGHLSRSYAIAYMAPVLASMIMLFRGNRLWGALFLMLSMALEIRSNHIQITYYLFLITLILVGFEFYRALKEKKLSDFWKAIAIQTGSVLIALAVNASLLLPTYEYSQLTTRGKANIVKVDNNKESKGLDKEYAYNWSQGVGENLTFLIPNAYGGRTQNVLDENSNVGKFFTSLGVPSHQAAQFASGLPAYWGEKPFTSGPWYFGAVVVMFFILGIFIVNNRLKWWILSSVILSILLAFGKHFPLISDLFFDYFPLYNKFRAVESTLVLASLLIPVLAVLALNELLNIEKLDKKLEKKIFYCFGGVLLLCLSVALIPELFLSFKNSSHSEFTQSIGQQLGERSLGDQVGSALIKDRKDLAVNDAYRSFFLIAISFALVWFFLKKKLNQNVLLVGLAILIVFDLWTVDKRYLNKDSFINKRSVESTIKKRDIDELILMDKDLSYRVLDLTTNSFSDAKASFYYKNLGGYHAAKLMRFQEILENQFSGAINEDVLDMFNTRYIISVDQSNQSERVNRRSSAAGNAWFVDRVSFVDSNAEEMRSLNSFDATKEAFVHKKFKSQVPVNKLGSKAGSSIKLISYHPDTLRYEYEANDDLFAVFSEVYYEKGWEAYIDGEPAPIIRTNYALRGLVVPEGAHEIEFVFAPKSVRIGNMISLAGSLVLGASFVGLIGFHFYRRRKE